MKLIFIIGTLLISGCGLVLNLAGLKMPRIQNAQSIQHYAQSAGLGNDELYAVDSNFIKKMRATPYKPGFKKGFRPMQVKMYDTNQNLVFQYASCEGDSELSVSLSRMPPYNWYCLDSSLTL